MIRLVQKVLPPATALWLFLVIYIVVSALELAVQMLAPQGLDEWTWGRRGALLAASGLFGAWRAFGFHPVARPAYQTWLETTPWNHSRPLPSGPVHLVWQDLVILATLAVLGWGVWEGKLIYVPLVFLSCYLLGACCTLAATGVFWAGYSIIFGLGLAVRLGQSEVVSFLVETGTYAIAYVGLRQALHSFPWASASLAGISTGFALDFARAREVAERQRTGFPFDVLRQHSVQPLLPLRHAVAISLLAGWLAHVALLAMNMTDRRAVSNLLVVGVILVGPLIRMLVYCYRYHPPITIWARLRTGRWILPAYDRVLLAPLAAGFVGFLLWWAASWADVRSEVSAPFVVSVVLSALLARGPTLGEWRLTGGHRIVPPFQNTELVRI